MKKVTYKYKEKKIHCKCHLAQVAWVVDSSFIKIFEQCGEMGSQL